MTNVQLIRQLIEAGHSDDEIEDILTEERIAAQEARDRGDYDDEDDGLSAGQKAMNDRLDMGRNDAGEWLGFM